MSTSEETTKPRQATGGSTIVAFARQTWAGLRVLLGLTVVLGVAYPLLVWGVGQVAFPWQANGSLVTADGAHTTDVKKAAGSALIGQQFTDDTMFWGRPSASDYDTGASGGTNQGPNNPDLVAAIQERRAELAKANDVAPSAIPADALTASGSGLDPDISPAYAYLQVDRVAAARGLDPAKVRALVASHVTGRELGVVGDPRVNVLLLNIDLGKLHP